MQPPQQGVAETAGTAEAAAAADGAACEVAAVAAPPAKAQPAAQPAKAAVAAPPAKAAGAAPPGGITDADRAAVLAVAKTSAAVAVESTDGSYSPSADFGHGDSTSGSYSDEENSESEEKPVLRSRSRGRRAPEPEPQKKRRSSGDSASGGDGGARAPKKQRGTPVVLTPAPAYRGAKASGSRRRRSPSQRSAKSDGSDKLSRTQRSRSDGRVPQNAVKVWHEDCAVAADISAAVAAASWHRTTLNLMVAQYVVTAEVEWYDLRWLLMKSPAHILLVIYEHESDRFDDMIRTGGNWNVIFLGGCAAVLTHKGRMDGAAVKVAKVHEGQHRFEVCIVRTKAGYHNPNAAVAVGLLCKNWDEPHDGAPYSDEFLEQVGLAVKQYRVRFLAGTFGKTQADVNKVCSFGGAERWGHPFCQPWWVGTAWNFAAVAARGAACDAPDAAVADDAADAAVAAYWDLEKRYVGEYAACPFYLIIFGPWSCVDFPTAKTAQTMPEWLCDDGFFRDRLLRLTDVPHEHARSRWPDAGAADAAVAAQTFDLGKLKQKYTDERWNVAGVHQVVVWVGTARSGKRSNRQRKGK